MNDLHQQYIEDFHVDWSAQEDIRDMANEEHRFNTVPGGQWEDWLTDAYENRARLELNHTSHYVNRNVAQWTQNRQIPNYQASDEQATDDQADLLDGLLRRDLQKGGGQAAIDTAVTEAFTCGMGAIVLNTTHEDEGDPENENQNIVITEQPNAYSTVVFDSGSRTADKIDAKHCTILTPYTRKSFEKKWPDANPDSLEKQDRSWFNWSSNDLVYVATRYEVKWTRQEIQVWSHPASGDIIKLSKEDAEKDNEELQLAGYTLSRTRVIKRKKVYKSVFTGSEILEDERAIVGEYIPVIPFYGNRSYVDGVEHFHGLVRPVMDAQRVLNMAFSLTAETAAHSSEDKPIFLKEQVQNPTISDALANHHNKAYLVVDAVKDSQGNPVQTQPGVLPGTRMSPVVADVLNIAIESITQSTGGLPQDTLDPNASGKAINAMLTRIDQNTAPIHDNIRKGITHFGRVYASMAQPIYSASTNRFVRIISDRGESQGVKLNETVGVGGKVLSVNDLSRGKFDVVVSTSTDYQTAKEETFESMKDILAVLPETSPWREVLTLQLVLLKEGQGLEGLQKNIRKTQILQGHLEPESEEEIQMLQQAQQTAQNQPPDPNAAYLEAEAEKATTEAQLALAKIADVGASAVKKASEAEEIKVDIALKKKELYQPTPAHG